MSTRHNRIYACEMSDADHRELLELLLLHPGPVMISGYDNEIYKTLLEGWHKITRLANCEGGAAEGRSNLDELRAAC
jgi:DNA adenine methylase